MTTVIDPNGTPVPVYNKSGTTIQNITANGTTQGSGTVISAPSACTAVLVTVTSGGGDAVVLPNSIDIGNVVEIYATGAYDTQVFPASGHSIGDNAANASIYAGRCSNQNGSGGRIFRRMTATMWQVTYG